MAQKKVVVSFHRVPFGTIYYTEGLRAAVGLTAGTDEHSVEVVYQGDGVFYALKGVDRSDAIRYLATLKKVGAKLYAESESLAARGVAAKELADDVEVIGRAKVLDLFRAADLNIDF